MNCGDRAKRACSGNSTTIEMKFRKSHNHQMLKYSKDRRGRILLCNLELNNRRFFYSKKHFVQITLWSTFIAFFFIRTVKNSNLRYRLAALALAKIAHKAVTATNDFILIKFLFLIRCVRFKDESQFNLL